MTAVLPGVPRSRHRTRLKHATIAWAIEHGLTALETGNDEGNAPMRGVNARLGYRPLPDGVTMRGPLFGGIMDAVTDIETDPTASRPRPSRPTRCAYDSPRAVRARAKGLQARTSPVATIRTRPPASPRTATTAGCSWSWSSRSSRRGS